jgi:predicted negative regulator of RcsB-dependent stress response
VTTHSRKEFLKRNDFATAVGRGVGFFEQNVKFLMAIGLLVVAVVAGLYFLKTREEKRLEGFNARFYAAEKGLKKEVSYRALLQEFGDVPASALVRLALVGNLLDNQKPDEALKVLDEGLHVHLGADIFTTLLVVKKIDVLKGQGDFTAAAAFADQAASRVIDTYRDSLLFTRADLLLLAGQWDDAKALYQRLAVVEEGGEGEEKAQKKDRADPQLPHKAKGRLKLIEFGLI